MTETRDSRDRLIVESYRSGHSLRQIGKEVGLSHERVRQVLMDAGISRRPDGSEAASKTLAAVGAVLAADGSLSITAASRAVGADKSTVSQYLRRRHPQFDYKARRRAALEHLSAHGTLNRYNNYGCRCDACRAANAQSTVIVPVDVFETMRHQVDNVREWAIDTLRKAASP